MIPGGVPPRGLCCTAFMMHAKIQTIVRTQTLVALKDKKLHSDWILASFILET